MAVDIGLGQSTNRLRPLGNTGILGAH
jgi:hypothetical protein